MPIDHTSLPVQNLEASKAFYTEILKPLAYGIFMEFPGNALGFAPKGGRSDFWISAPLKGKENQDGNLNVTHVAFAGNSKEQVDEFHANALKAGAKCNGPPGFRTMYHEKYYAAFILDPDGNNVECVYFDL
ncbi:hypothetical protein IFR04_005364 [Cadophora malorum]|uniref:VOC domain-containing protein n=1 Tax=Cadophora malorum TaxID=108018 RepID=A0A8H7W8W0_9HELO|nr:hypothetical protein IFR04_005364 [Cadophora malorum]